MTLYHPSREDIELPTVLHALSDPQRLRIVRRLAQAPEPCQCGAFGLDVTKSTLTHHFRVLREAGVITQRHVGTSKLNSLRREDLDACFPGLLTAVLAAPEPRVPAIERAAESAAEAALDPAVETALDPAVEPAYAAPFTVA